MSLIRKIAVVSACVGLALVAAPAWSGPYRHHTHVGVYVGPVWDPWFYPPPVYYYPPPPPVVIERQPPVYIEQAPPAAPEPTAYWYYCAPSKAYYPTVKQCPAGWTRIAPPQPPQ